MFYSENRSFNLPIGLVAIYLIYKSLSAFVVYIRRFRLIKQHGCQRVASTLGSWPLGLDDFHEELTALASDNLLNVYDARFKLYGNTWARNTGGVRRCKYVTCEPKILQAILATEFSSFPVAPHAGAAAKFAGNKSVFALDGVPWEHARAMLKPQFVRDQVADFTDLEGHVQRFIRRVCPNDTATIDVQPLFRDLIMDSSTEALFGVSADTQLADDAQSSSDKKAGILLSEALEVGAHVSSVRLAMGVVASWFLLGREVYRKFDWACKTCHTFVDNYVEKAIKRHEEKQAGKLEHGEHLKPKKYVALNELAEVTQDREALRSHAMGLLIAGRDTTSAMLSWTVYILARHPAVYAKLRKQVIDVFGEAESGKLPTYNELKGLQYLQWVLREAMRLLPSVPLNLRIAIKDVVLPVGGGPDGQAPLLIKAGEGILYSIFSMHRRKDLYGKDAEEFHPERWGLDGKGQGLRAIGWGYLPFSGGPKVCMGQQRALNEGAYILARIAQVFENIELPEEEEEEHGNEHPRFRMGITVSIGNGVRVKLTRGETGGGVRRS